MSNLVLFAVFSIRADGRQHAASQAKAKIPTFDRFSRQKKVAAKKLLQRFSQRLTNLSATNRSLVLLRLYVGQYIDVQVFDYLLGKPAFDIVRQLAAGKTRISLCEVADARDAAGNRVSYLLKQLHRTAQAVLEEQGAENLCVGYPFVLGRFNNDAPVRCPLLFFPVRLAPQNGKWQLTLREDVPVGFNKTFLLAYAHHNGLPLNQILHEWTLDAPAEDMTAFLTMLYRLLESAQLEVHFNAAQFAERLQPFSPLTKKELQVVTATGRLKLMPQAVLGQFPQADSYLAPDYDVLLADETIDDLEIFFNKNVASSAVREEDIVTPYETDAAQENALRLIKSGQSIVVQGPPGTGKSQLIVNLIADAVAAGRRVLVVCQKKAALDVVYNRLREKELHCFAALVHDFQQDRARIYADIARQIQQVYQKLDRRVDLEALQYERQFLHAARLITESELEPQAFRQALFDESICGISAKQLYLTCSPNRPHVHFDDTLREYFRADRAQAFVSVLRRYVACARQTDAPNSLWRNRHCFADKSAADLRPMQQILQQMPAQIAALKQALAENPLTQDFARKKWSSVRQLLQALPEAETRLLPHADFLQREKFNAVALIEITLQKEHLFEEWQTYLRQALAAAEILQPRQLDEALLPEAIRLLQSYMQDQTRTTGKIKWMFAFRKKKAIRAWLAHCHLPFTTEGIVELLRQLNAYEQWRQSRQAMRSLLPSLSYPIAHDAEAWKTFAEQTLACQRLSEAWREFARKHLPDFDLRRTRTEQLPQQWHALVQTLRQIAARQNTWNGMLSESQQAFLWDTPEEAETMCRQLEALFEDLCAVDALYRQMSNRERRLIDLLHAQMPHRYDEWLAVFDNSWRLAWLYELENRFPVLRKASGQSLLQIAEQLRSAVEEKQRLARFVAHSRAWERALEKVKYNRLQNPVSYRDLLHQVSKKRGVWPLRKLIAVHWEELANLIPCWLVSPESASALFPVQPIFDLVIFDEASQCFAEKGIPAMYRGKQVVIVGDDKQLAPFDLYRPRWEEINPEEDLAPELEAESLLDLGKRYLPQIMLTGHYRSRYPELIEFSNRHFYQNKLQMLPFRTDWQPQKSPIRFVKVAGIWEGKTNRIEAEAVLQIIAEQLAQHPDKSIGVITFNIHQQQLIMDLLEQSNLLLPSSLFVKNIENVQGDERDCIIFSVGYAPSPSGKMQLHFGSLSQAKGENRLNVAVTRARESIIVVSSIYPQQLPAENTANEGPRLLRAYLEYAYAVSQQAARPRPIENKLPPQEESLAYRLLQAANGRLQNGHPFADLTAYDQQGNPVKMILTDDLPFYREASVRGFFVYRPLHFARKGWQYEYAFSRNWWRSGNEALLGLFDR